MTAHAWDPQPLATVRMNSICRAAGALVESKCNEVLGARRGFCMFRLVTRQ
jgi:hypothetical protein